ncbi:unnamed protein product [Amoebophrya sp. A120]|nr:unnamed protein product [Amoebophrya sp. A120]|eukprot:GSA120T00007475001.1
MTTGTKTFNTMNEGSEVEPKQVVDIVQKNACSTEKVKVEDPSTENNQSNQHAGNSTLPPRKDIMGEVGEDKNRITSTTAMITAPTPSLSEKDLAFAEELRTKLVLLSITTPQLPDISEDEEENEVQHHDSHINSLKFLKQDSYFNDTFGRNATKKIPSTFSPSSRGFPAVSSKVGATGAGMNMLNSSQNPLKLHVGENKKLDVNKLCKKSFSPPPSFNVPVESPMSSIYDNKSADFLVDSHSANPEQRINKGQRDDEQGLCYSNCMYNARDVDDDDGGLLQETVIDTTTNNTSKNIRRLVQNSLRTSGNVGPDYTENDDLLHSNFYATTSSSCNKSSGEQDENSSCTTGTQLQNEQSTNDPVMFSTASLSTNIPKLLDFDEISSEKAYRSKA